MPISRLPACSTFLLAIAILAGCASHAVPSGSLPTGTAAGDQPLSPFYDWRDPLPAREGAMLRQEPMPAQPEITAAGAMQRILYTSNDARWKSGLLPVSGTLYLPEGAPPPGGWPLLAWAHGTLGVADSCAPSWTLHRPRDAHYMNRWLEQGFAVVASDYQGLGGPGPHPYLVWEAEGRSVLDSVRAALAAYPGQLANDIVITGQSQGSGAALGAGQIAAAYAPELRLRAIIATGVGATFPDGPIKLGQEASGRNWPPRFNMLRLVGGSLPDDGPTAERLVTDKGRQVLAMARTTCVDQLRDFERKESIDKDNAFTLTPDALMQAMLPVTDMKAIRFPVLLFLGTGLADRTISPHRQFAAAHALCDAGNPLVWKSYAGITHNGVVNAAFEDQLQFVRELGRGVRPAGNCATLRDPGPSQAATPGIRYND